MKTKITELLGIEYPIVQGAMAWIAEHHLAAAVSKAGGLGIIAGGAAPVDYIREEIHKARAITDKPLGMNIMLLSRMRTICTAGHRREDRSADHRRRQSGQVYRGLEERRH